MYLASFPSSYEGDSCEDEPIKLRNFTSNTINEFIRLIESCIKLSVSNEVLEFHKQI